MAARKPKEFNKIPVKRLTESHLKELIAETLVKSTQDIYDTMSILAETNPTSVIEMAVVRCAWLAYYEGDTKRLEWMLNKMGIKEVKAEESTGVDLSKIDSATILKALSVKEGK